MFKGKKILLTAALLTGLFSFGVIDHVDAAPVKNYSVKTLKNDSRVFAVDKSIETKFVTFKNRFGIELAGHMYLPKNFNANKKYPALAVCGAFGAVKEQISGLYAQQMAERGFIAVAFDPSFTGESGGTPRYVASPDINTEDFSAAVDFLSVQSCVDPDRIGIIGICGWGGLALNAAAIDTRIKATVVTTMYDMSRVIANGYFDYDKTARQVDRERQENRQALNAQRTEDFKNGTYMNAGGVPTQLQDDAPQFLKDYFEYYKTGRGYHERSLNSNKGWNTTSALSFMNTKQLSYIEEIKTPVLMIHGEKAHSRYFSEDAFEQMTGIKRNGTDTVLDNKELLIIPGASHTDLYDRIDIIPFDRIEKFFEDNLK